MMGFNAPLQGATWEFHMAEITLGATFYGEFAVVDESLNQPSNTIQPPFVPQSHECIQYKIMVSRWYLSMGGG